MKSSIIDPTYPAVYSNFNRAKTFIYFSLRQFVIFITIYDLIFSLLGTCFGSIYIFIDYLSRIEFSRNWNLIQYVIHIPVGIFVDSRVIFHSSWTLDFMSKYAMSILYSHLFLNLLLLFCSWNMYYAIQNHKPTRAICYFISKTAYFVHTSTIFIQWITNRNEQDLRTIQIFYGDGKWGFLTAELNVFCLILLDFLWKTTTLIISFRSIQYLRDYRLRNEHDSDKNSSSTLVVIEVNGNNKCLNI